MNNGTTFQGNGDVAYIPVVVNSKQTRQTNGDNFRAMSDEELAVWLALPYLPSPPWCSEHITCPYISEDQPPCDKCALDWLKEECE